MSRVQYRKGSPEDALCVGVLATQVFLDTYATEGVRADLAREVLNGYSPDAFLQRLRDEGTIFILAESAGNLAGFVEVTFGRRCPVESALSEVEIVRLYVQRPFHRQAIGRRLMLMAERSAQERGFTSVWLTAWCGNGLAKAFYAVLGYSRVGRVQHVIEGQTYENDVCHQVIGAV